MFISIIDIFKIGIGPSSSHTMGPMIAANDFRDRVMDYLSKCRNKSMFRITCTLKGSLAYTGKGHATDRAVALGLHGYMPHTLADKDIDGLIADSSRSGFIKERLFFSLQKDIIFDRGKSLPEHPNGMVFKLLDQSESIMLSETYFSIGGGFVKTCSEMHQKNRNLKEDTIETCTYPFESAKEMLAMAVESGLSIVDMKMKNECQYHTKSHLEKGLDTIWSAMKDSVERGLNSQGILPGGLNVSRRAKILHEQLLACPEEATVNDWLSAYAIAVNEENAAGNVVVTAPTNGAAGVIPAILYYYITHKSGNKEHIYKFLLVASVIGGLIKHRSSISGAEVGCQGEVGSAASMAAAGLCAILGGSSEQIENAAEIALEHHLGMTCDPVKGLVQIPCIERNAFGAVKAYTAANLALRGTGQHIMSLDNCIAAMKQTGLEMSSKYKETSLGGLAVNSTDC